MLSLERPLGVVADLALFGDHALPERVYFVPTKPRIASAGSAGQELAFVKFRPSDVEDGGVGLLSFTTELVATPQQLELAKQHVIRQGVPEPVFAQVPWIGGKAVFATALAEGDGFVEKLLGEVKPDLAGGNRALFSVKLTQDGARLVEAMIRNEGPSPLGVRYELEYAGLRPALDVHIRADYKRIYDEFSIGFEFGVAYEGVGVRASVESATQKLIQSGAIVIEVLHFTDSADLQKRVDEAVRWFQEKLLEDFFKTSLQPPAHENLLQKAVDAARALGAASLQEAAKNDSMAGQLAQTLGISPDALKALGGQSATSGAAGGATGAQSTFALKLQFTLRDVHQEELKTLTLDWTQSQPEKRTAAPQGLLARIGGPPKIVEAQDTGAFWDTLKVTVRPLGDLEALGVLGMVVQLAYPDERAPQNQASLTFSPSDLAPKRFSAWTNGRAPRYRGRVEVRFKENGPWAGPPIFTGVWQTLESLDLAVHPLSDVPRIELEIAPGTLLFSETPQAQVDLRIDGQIVATHMISEVRPTATFRRRLSTSAAPTLAPLQIESRVTWFLAGGKRVEGTWTPVEGTALLVHRPWRSTRTVRVLPLLPENYIDALVTLALQEPSRSDAIELRLEPGTKGAKTVSLPSLLEQAPPVQIDTLVIRGDGSTFIAEPVVTRDPVVLIRDRDGPQRQVNVRLLAGATLASHGLMAVQVQLLDRDGSTLDSIVFTESRRTPTTLLVPVTDGMPARYRIVRYAIDGSASEGAIETVPPGELLVPAVART